LGVASKELHTKRKENQKKQEKRIRRKRRKKKKKTKEYMTSRFQQDVELLGSE